VTTELYYFLGYNGTGAANAGGDGGTATMVTTNDLATEQAIIADTLLIGGGGGGGGAGRGKKVCGCDGLGICFDYVYGALGGDGGVAISPQDIEALAPGATGGERHGYKVSGLGALGDTPGTGGGVNGNDSSLSSPATVGATGIVPIGGRGGNHTDPQTGFVNSTTVISNANDNGQGGDGQDDAGGGGGGGGYGGGGGAGNVDNGDPNYVQCNTGGGGGGASLAVISTATCAGAPTSDPGNPNGSQGFAQIVFDLGGCQ
jgi:hypothetical protein